MSRYSLISLCNANHRALAPCHRHRNIKVNKGVLDWMGDTSLVGLDVEVLISWLVLFSLSKRVTDFTPCFEWVGHVLGTGTAVQEGRQGAKWSGVASVR